MTARLNTFYSLSSTLHFLCAVLILFLASGCALFGLAASGLPQFAKAKYDGLKGQSVGIMVWVDRGTLIDWGTIQLDLANSVQTKLQESPAEEVKEATYPVEPRSIVRYQRDHPEIDAIPVTEFAGKLTVSRLIYIEMTHFRTRSETELELFRGTVTASLKVIAVDANGVARIDYSEDNIQAVFPRDAPQDGLPQLGDKHTYNGTIQTLATEIANRLVTHEDDGR